MPNLTPKSSQDYQKLLTSQLQNREQQLKKSRFLSLVKKKTPRLVRQGINVVHSIADPILCQSYQKQHGWDRPIPPLQLRIITSDRTIDGYVKSGKSIVDSFAEELKKCGLALDRFRNILDFGCGAGRQIQYMSGYRQANLTGCDPNEAHIKWLSKSYPGANFYRTNFNPPLPFADKSFDLIYSVSVFTHLSEKLQYDWLKELKRVLKPQGIALLTTLGEYAAKRNDILGINRHLYEQLIAEDLVFKLTPGTRSLNKFINPKALVEEEMYGLTYHSQKYIAENWSKYFEVVNIVPGCISNLQDLVILQK
ncbi:MAG: class I SAM-dependent methyltransferase [Cyanosarcina radialis HA8281-LM2]|jgi:SAM-dependent methyltransferase|nr:class I SAM-dependent methyltransferase [Cyanosarcina radialis HA8281-LM2]